MNLHLWQLRQSSEQASHAESHEAAWGRRTPLPGYSQGGA